ncbi:tetratricopeptide repeat protein [Streptomyces phaeochromogenes]|uniref:tetratricopeptide repeat protein n=1 Tax=Streptomyces phaeochromogenes TaxID=1923 RepID=UPI003411D63F
MIARGPGRPEGSLPADLPPAWRDFVSDLRRYREMSGLTLRDLARRAHVSAGTLSKITGGSRLPSRGTLESLLTSLGVEGEDRRPWLERFDAIVAERDAASVGPTNALATREGGLPELLNTLKDESGLSVREITDRITLQGIDVGKSSVDRALRNPGQSPQLSFHTAEVLIDELPMQERGPVRSALFQATGRSRASWPLQIGVMPRRSAGFQRRAAAAVLASVLEGSDVAAGRAAVLCGMAGSGKTQLAADYARNAWTTSDLDLLVWLDASSRTAVTDGYAQAAACLLGTDPADPASVQEFLAWLEPKREQRPCRWLIVLDDVSAPDDLHALWPPDSPYGGILVTSRRRDAALAGEGRRVIQVDPFTQDESVAYLTAALGAASRHEPAEELADLAEALGNLPLALSQAAASLIDSACSAAYYRQILAHHNTKLSDIAPDILPDDQHSSLASAWSLSIQRANDLRPHALAEPLLRLAAFLDTVIPEAVFTTQPALDYLARSRSFLPQHGRASSTEVEQEDARRAVRALHRLSLVDHVPDLPDSSVWVHRLTQRMVRESLPAPDYAETARTAADALCAAWPDTESVTALDHPLLASALALAGHAGDELLQPAVHPVMFRAGRGLGQIGDAVKALAYFTHLTDRLATRLGPDHPDVLAARFEAARWNGEAGHWDEARPLLSNLLDDQIRVLGTRDPDTLTTLHEFARSSGETGRSHSAIAEFSRLLHYRVLVLGDEHLDTLRARRSRAHWLGETGSSAAAVTDLSDLLPRMARILGPEHPELFITQLLHGHWVGEAGEPDQAVDLLSHLLQDMVRVLGDDHPDTLTALSELARWTGKSGDPAQAAAILDDVAHRMTRVLGQDHPHTISARRNLAICQGNAGDAIGAAGALAALMSRALRALGSDRSRTLTTHHTLGHRRQKTKAEDAIMEGPVPRTDRTSKEKDGRVPNALARKADRASESRQDP